MALENLEPENRAERLLSGADLEPANRLEYFLKQAGSGGSGSGKCTLTETGLAESYNDLLSMLSNGFIPFYKGSDGLIWICSSCDAEGEGIIFKRNTDSNASAVFVYEDSPDNPLIFD